MLSVKVSPGRALEFRVLNTPQNSVPTLKGRTVPFTEFVRRCWCPQAMDSDLEGINAEVPQEHTPIEASQASGFRLVI